MTTIRVIVGFAFAAALGSYAPLALLYLALPFVTQTFELKLVGQFLLRSGGVVLMLFVFAAAFGFMLSALGYKTGEDPLAAGGGLGAAVGFLGGVTAFVVGIRRGMRRKATSVAGGTTATHQ